MALTAAEGRAGQDPRYRQGMAHLQVGEWAEAAIGCFDELAHAYPNPEAFQRALAEAQFKARLDAADAGAGTALGLALARHGRAGPARGRLASWPCCRGAPLHAALVPMLADYRQERNIAQLAGRLRRLLKAGKLERGRGLLPGAAGGWCPTRARPAGLQQVAEEREIVALYGQAVARQEAGDCPEALALFQLQVRAASYQDVNLRIDACRREQQRAALFAQARRRL
jgi:hypothetical protein